MGIGQVKNEGEARGIAGRVWVKSVDVQTGRKWPKEKEKKSLDFLWHTKLRSQKQCERKPLMEKPRRHRKDNQVKKSSTRKKMPKGEGFQG
jgi:hypothetical protein